MGPSNTRQFNKHNLSYLSFTYERSEWVTILAFVTSSQVIRGDYMANQLTSSGLTVGSGTITNFIPVFGSNVIGSGAATVTVPPSDIPMPSSENVNIGVVYPFNVKVWFGDGTGTLRLPSDGRYAYVVKTVIGNSSLGPDKSELAGTYTIPPNINVSGGYVIAVNGNSYIADRAGGGFVRVE